MTEIILHIKDHAPSNPKTLDALFYSLSDGRYIVRIKNTKHRSLPQNAYYHGVIVPMVKDGLIFMGFNEVKTNEDAHEVMKHLFLKEKIKSEQTGDEIIIPGSTAKLTTLEFETYLEEIRQWAASYLGIAIGLPNEQLEFFTH